MSTNPNSLAGNGFIIDGFSGPTFSMTSSNTAQSIAASKLTLDARSLIGMLVSVDTNNIRGAFGGTAATTLLGHMIYAGGSIQIKGKQNAKTFSFISAVAGAHGVLHITPYYK